MEICPVGNRCKKCAARFDSHVTKISKTTVAKTAFAAVLAGFAYGLIHLHLSSGYTSWILLYVEGFLVGQGLHKVSNYKLGRTVLVTIVLSTILGALLSPNRNAMLGMPPDAFNRSANAKQKFAGGAVKIAIEASELKAQKNFNQFADAFRAKRGKNFWGRIAFSQGERKAYMWFTVEKLDGTNIFGTLSTSVSDPRKFDITSVKAGDPVETKLSELEDWRYETDTGEIVGDFTNKYLDSLTPQPADSSVSPQRLARFWINFILFLFGIVSPILRMKTGRR